MDSMVLSTKLLDMIGEVTNASDERNALLALLNPLLTLFNMDQAAYCEKTPQGEVKILFGVDRFKQILSNSSDLWLSATLFDQCFLTMMPVTYVDPIDTKADIPRSIEHHALKNVVCVPVSKSPDRAVYLASRRGIDRRFSKEEIESLRTASRAASLALHQHFQLKTLKDGNEALRNALNEKSQRLLYSSRSMHMVLEEAKKLAPFNVSIVIHGESGSGKEELAKEIHRMSGRKGRFIAVNCANLTETLLESELFGYSKGAFTGAVQSKKGLFQEAEGGTFFLDEIAELPMILQGKLLRVLQERQIRPLGGSHDLEIDVRFLAASHRDLKQAVSEKKFRDDLYYRIQEMSLNIPSLRERLEDIEILAQHFVTHFSQEFRLPEKILSEDAIQKLASYEWPGNVRELKNICRTSVILSNAKFISGNDIRIPSLQKQITHFAMNTTSRTSLKELSIQFENDTIRRLLAEPHQTQTSVAQRLNVSVRTLQRLLERDHLREPSADKVIHSQL